MIVPHPYQVEAADSALRYITHNDGCHPLIGMPTGSGKTVVLSEIIKRVLAEWSDTKILVLSHIKEISSYLDMEVGLYSSGLKSRRITQVTVAGIQSIWRHPAWFQEYKLIIIDEAHLIPNKGEGMYRSFFAELDNPVYLGLTATPYRLGTGYIYGKDAIFDDMIYDLTYMDKFNDLIKDGYLCPVRTKRTELTLNTEGLRLRGGEFIDKEMSDQFDKDQITEAAIKEIIKIGEDYKKWLIFAIDIEHAEHITEALLHRGIKAYIVHSKMGDQRRDNIIRMYKNNELRALVNVNILTTGFDSPDIDLIALLRPTHSPVFHVQTVGRGLRVAPGKDHCIVLDFAGNTERLGPINDIKVRKSKSTGEPGDPVTKTCPVCKTIHHPIIKICEVCGHEFEFKSLLTPGSIGAQLIATAKRAWHEITDITYDIQTQKKFTRDGKGNLYLWVKILQRMGLYRTSGLYKTQSRFLGGKKRRNVL